MNHLLYLMFRCDFDVMENLENLEELNTIYQTLLYTMLHLPFSSLNLITASQAARPGPSGTRCCCCCCSCGYAAAAALAAATRPLQLQSCRRYAPPPPVSAVAPASHAPCFTYHPPPVLPPAPSLVLRLHADRYGTVFNNTFILEVFLARPPERGSSMV